MRRPITLSFAAAILLTATVALAQRDSKLPETFMANAQVSGNEAGSSANVIIFIEKYTSDDDRGKIQEALKSGGYPGFLPVLRAAPQVGYVEMGGRKVPVRYARQQATGSGRSITVVTESPLFFVGGGNPDAKPREGFDVAVIQMDVDSIGLGKGSMAAAAKVGLGGPTGVEVGDYASAPVKLVTVRKSYR